MLTLTNARLIDGTGRAAFDITKIAIEGNRVKSVETLDRSPSGTNEIDLQGLTVMPGLIDCHVHLGGLTADQPGRAIGEVSFRDTASFFWDYLHDYDRRRRLAIENGVTTIRSGGDHYPQIIRLRNKISAGRLLGPRIFAPGPTITAHGGHPAGTIYKRNRYIVEHAVRQIANVNDAREEARRLIEGKVDCIKAIYSDVDPMDVTRRVPRLALRTLEALADEAHGRGLKLMVHTGSPQETAEALEAGADSIEHGILPGSVSNEFGDDLAKLMCDKGTYFVPTLAIGWAYKETYPDLFSGLKRTVKRLSDAGVKIAAGTDSGTPGVVIGRGLHKELELMVEAGLSPLEAIVAGTSNAADCLGQADDLGTIEPGKLADIIAVTGDPQENICNTKNVALVIKDGKVLIRK